MENDHQVQTESDGHLQLPKRIIQHIQSFLTVKEAAQTTLFSKSWYGSWLTRTTLDFNEIHFPKPESQSDNGFVSFVKKSFTRYEESKLRIEKFFLSMNVNENELAFLVCEWIVKAVGMGAKYIDIDINSPGFIIILPKEIFEAKSLEHLVVCGRIVGGDTEEKVILSDPEQLAAENLKLVDRMIRIIFANYPLLEHVTLVEHDVCGNTSYVCFSDFSGRTVQHGTEMAQELSLIEVLKVKVELFEQTGDKLQSLPSKDSTLAASGRIFKFRLTWKPCADTGAHNS